MKKIQSEDLMVGSFRNGKLYTLGNVQVHALPEGMKIVGAHSTGIFGPEDALDLARILAHVSENLTEQYL